MRIIGLVFAGLVTVSVNGSLSGQNLRTDRFYWENDIGTSDRHYTNGLRFSTVTSSTELWQRRIEHPLLQVLLFGARACREGVPPLNCYHLRTGWAIGQNFYTPDVITDPSPEPTDRPYAGWLYYGQIFELSGACWTHEIEFDFGLIGPLSLSSSIQEGWHDLFGFPHPAGWDHQIARGLGIQAVYRPTLSILSTRVDGREVDSLSAAHVSAAFTGQISIGTPITSAQVGGVFRIGRGIPQAIVPRIGPVLFNAERAAIIAPNAAEEEGESAAEEEVRLKQEAYAARIEAARPRNARERPLYGFVGGSVHGVALNDFLEGTHLGATAQNPLIDLEINRVFAEYEAGATFAVPFVPFVGRADITLRRVWRGAEFDGAPEHRFWALSVAW